MPTNLKKTVIISVSAVSIGFVLCLNALYKDLYKHFPNNDRKILRKAYRRTLKNALEGKYKMPDSQPELLMLILDEIVELQKS